MLPVSIRQEGGRQWLQWLQVIQLVSLLEPASGFEGRGVGAVVTLDSLGRHLSCNTEKG